MKAFSCLVVLVAAVAAEPPRYRAERQQTAPYPAAGARPAAEFPLPARQALQPPATAYGVPADSYAAPQASYGAPQSQYGTPRADGRANDDREPTDENRDAEAVDVGAERKGKLQEVGEADAGVERTQGAYYVLLPGARLQRVQFRTENDPRAMAYSAQLRYSAADQAPLYVYTPAAAPVAAAPVAAPAAAAAAAYVQLF